MDVCIMEILAFLYVTILLHLIANDLRTENRSFCLYSICVRCVRYILYGQELKANELNSLATDENHDSIKQSQKLHEISLEEPLNNDLRKPSTALIITGHSTESYYTFTHLQNATSEASGFQKPIGQLSRVNQSTVSSEPVPIAGCSTETITDSFLQDASSETSGHQELMGQLSEVNQSPVIYEPEPKTNPDSKVLPSIALTNTNYSTETDNAYSFFQDASSEKAGIQKPIGQLPGVNSSTVSSGTEPITSCSTETSTDSFNQDTSSHTSSIQKSMGKLSGVNPSTVSSGPEHITSCSTEANTDSFLQDVSSHTTGILKSIGQLSGLNPSTVSSGLEPITGCSTEANTDFFLQDVSSYTTGIQKPVGELSKVNPSTVSSGSVSITSCSIKANTDSFLQDLSSHTTVIQKPIGELSEVNPSTVSSGSEPITSLTTETNTDSFLQDTTVIQKLVGELSGLNPSTVSSGSEPIASCSIEANTDSFLQDTSSHTTGIQKPSGLLSGVNSSTVTSELEPITSLTETNTDCISSDVYSETDFEKLFLRPETSMALTTIDTSKGFEISVCELSERDLQNHAVTDGILPIWWTTDEESRSESDEIVQCSLNELKSTDYSIPHYSCDITLESSDHDNTLRTLALWGMKSYPSSTLKLTR